jgi:hypothetical protein
MSLAEEAERMMELLAGKIVAKVFLPRDGEVVVEFSDLTRLFVNARGDRIEISIT